MPADATKKTHPKEREQLKVCCGLGAMYGAGARSVASLLGINVWQAERLLWWHRHYYRRYWEWSEATYNTALLDRQLRSTFGWTLNVTTDTKPGTIFNFPMQSNGAEMLRFACILATEGGICVCAPVHDALLIEASLEEIDDHVARTRLYMEEASEMVLPGFSLRTSAEIVRYPDRYVDERGRGLWETVQGLLDREGTVARG